MRGVAKLKTILIAMAIAQLGRDDLTCLDAGTAHSRDLGPAYKNFQRIKCVKD